MNKTRMRRLLVISTAALLGVLVARGIVDAVAQAAPTVTIETEDGQVYRINLDEAQALSQSKAAPAEVGEGPQFDAPYYILKEKNEAKWVAEDKQIDVKLGALYQRFGKRPNIIYVLADDVGWGEPGCYLGGKLRGTPTPTLDKMAAEGMKFLSHYAEPSCTPTRIAINTGRHPVRTGLNAVLWPGQTEGLSPDELTSAEILSAAGYHTAMWGKWHVGELAEHAPENQGFDFAYYSLYNGAAWGWPDQPGLYEGAAVPGRALWYDYPGNEKYEEMYGIEIRGVFEGRKGQGRKEVGEISSAGMDAFEEACAHQIVNFIEEKANSDKPFFIYWPTFNQQVAGSPIEYRHQPGIDTVNNQAAQMAAHNDHLARILVTLENQGIAENTLVVWVSDNGPMYAFWPNSGYSWLRGGKGDVYEGGVRTPGIAYWPGMIKPGQDPIDMIHVVDLFTTAARLGGALDRIPGDRVTDGVDQTALLLLGEGHSRRDYMIHYSGTNVGAVRLGDIKGVISGPGHGGLPGVEVFNIRRDPRETQGTLFNYLHMVTPMQNLLKSHLAMMERFPNRVLPPHQDVLEKAELLTHD